MIGRSELLEKMRDQLQAATLTATYETRHGVVALVADGGSVVRVWVNGEEVPQEDVA